MYTGLLANRQESSLGLVIPFYFEWQKKLIKNIWGKMMYGKSLSVLLYEFLNSFTFIYYFFFSYGTSTHTVYTQ